MLGSRRFPAESLRCARRALSGAWRQPDGPDRASFASVRHARAEHRDPHRGSRPSTALRALLARRLTAVCRSPTSRSHSTTARRPRGPGDAPCPSPRFPRSHRTPHDPIALRSFARRPERHVSRLSACSPGTPILPVCSARFSHFPGTVAACWCSTATPPRGATGGWWRTSLPTSLWRTHGSCAATTCAIPGRAAVDALAPEDLRVAPLRGGVRAARGGRRHRSARVAGERGAVRPSRCLPPAGGDRRRSARSRSCAGAGGGAPPSSATTRLGGRAAPGPRACATWSRAWRATNPYVRSPPGHWRITARRTRCR